MADDTGSDISAELGPVDVVQVPGGLEHGTVRRLGDVQLTHQRYGPTVAHRQRPGNRSCSLWNARSNM